MRLLMVSGDRQSSVGEIGPFHQMQAEFSRWFERIDVLCPKPDRAVTTTRIHEVVHLHPAPVGRARMVGWIEAKGRDLLAQHGARLIVSHDYGWFYNGLGAARLSRASGVPYLSEIHHVPGHPVAASLRERFDKWVARRYVRWAVKRAAAFRVVNSGEMPDLLSRWGVPRERILVLPSLYIDLDCFRPAEAGFQRTRDLLFVGRLVENKGLFALLDALVLLQGQGLRPRLTLVGRGPLRGRLEARAAALGLADRLEWIEWLPGPKDLADAYRSARVVVCASTCEGGPRVTVEALASGTPVVSTPVGVMGELLAEGRGGALAGFDAAGLAQGIGAVLGDAARWERAAGEARALAERYEYARVLEGYARGLHELVGQEARRR